MKVYEVFIKGNSRCYVVQYERLVVEGMLDTISPPTTSGNIAIIPRERHFIVPLHLVNKIQQDMKKVILQDITQ